MSSFKSQIKNGLLQIKLLEHEITKKKKNYNKIYLVLNKQHEEIHQEL